MTMRNHHPPTPGKYGSPGVYFEEILPPQPPAFRSGVPVFAGFVERRPARPKGQSPWRALTRWDQFPPLFGGAVAHGFLAYGVRGFFENGGAHCFILPLPLPEGAGRPGDTLRESFREGGILDDLEDADLVCVPDATMVALDDPAGATELQCAVLEYCRRMKDRFAILDALPVGAGGAARGQEEGRARFMTALLEQGRALCSDAGALYFPRLCVPSLKAHAGASRYGPGRGPHAILVPPSGHVAGIYARSDGRAGVHKAPANEGLEGVFDLEFELAGDQQEFLNAAGINCIRSIPGRGIRVWGARTLSRQPGWRYVNVRRLFLMLNRWLVQNMRDLVFEANAPALWERVRDRLDAYCYELFRRGALKGATLEQSFFVKCDAETNPLEEREAGRLIAEVGLAAEVPAEFVIVRITQSVAGIHVTVPEFVS